MLLLLLEIELEWNWSLFGIDSTKYLVFPTNVKQYTNEEDQVKKLSLVATLRLSSGID